MEVRGAERANLASVDQLRKRGQRVLLCDRIIVLMREIQIDCLYPQVLQRGVAGRRNARGGELLAAFSRQHADLGGDQDVVPPTAGLQPFADHALGFPTFMTRCPGGIDIGGVDHRAAARYESVDHREARRLVGGPAEYVATEHQWRDVEIGRAEAPQYRHGNQYLFSAGYYE